MKILFPILALLLSGCAVDTNVKWKNLFNGKDLTGWTTANNAPVSKGWRVDQGAIHIPANSRAGDIYTKDAYHNFELKFQWKVDPKSNSGVKYRVALYNNKLLGPEYQVLDDGLHANGKNPLTSAAALYAILPASDTKKLKPVGQYNQGRIVVKDNWIQHWLNGECVLDTDISSQDFQDRRRKSKFKNLDDFGTKKGRIMLQDHSDSVWFKEIFIREL